MADKRISQLVERTDIANNDVVPIVASGATTTNKATISSIQEFMQENLDLGVTSVGITLGTTGTDVSVTGSPITTSGNITINLPTASATNRGLLSATDWTTFNNKQAAGNYVTLDTAQTITGAKTFELTDLRLAAEGSVKETTITNVNSDFAVSTIRNYFGFNNANNIFFSSPGKQGAILSFDYTQQREYALPDADGTIALTSQLDGYVTLNTAQTITAQKTFTTSGSSDTMIISHGSGSGFALDVIKAGNGETLRVTKTSGSGNAMSVIGGILSTEGISSTAPANAISLLLNGRSADNVGIIAFGANTGGGQYNFIQASPTSLIVGSRGNTPLEFHTNVNGGGGPRMTIAGSGGVTFTNGITTTSAVLTSVLQGVNANFSGLIETSDSLRIGTTASVKHNSTIFTLNGYNNIQGNINSFAVYNGTKGMRINFPSNESFTHTLPDASGTIALTSNLGAYLPLTGGTLTGALNGTSASFTGDITTTSSNIGGINEIAIINTATSGASSSRLRISTAVNGGTTLGDAITQYTDNNNFNWSTGSGVTTSRDYVITNHFTLGTNVFLRLAASTGAATFSSSVTATNLLTTSMSGSAINIRGIETLNSPFGITWTTPTYVGGLAAIRVERKGAADASDMMFYTAPNGDNITERMRITSGGNVGIGTASPSTSFVLDVHSQNLTFNSRLFQPSSNTGAYCSLFVSGAMTSATGYFGIGGSAVGNTAFRDSVVIGSQSASPLVFNTSDFERMRITSDGFARLSASSGGIQFNGDTAAANALDDYEEGTWTPTVADASSGGNLATLSADSQGVYTKIGRVVYFRFSVILTSKASMTAGNTLFVRGFPFQSQSIPGSWYRPNATIIRNITFTGYVQFNQGSGSTAGWFRENISNANGDDITVSDLTDSAAMQVSGFYFI
jgi:hypothetical protein